MKSLYNADRWVALHFPMEEWPRDIITGSPEVTHRPQDTGAGAQNLVLWYIFPASSASFPTHAMWWTPPVDLWKYLLLPSSPTQLPAAVDTHRPGGTCRDWARSPPPHPHPSTTLPPPRADVGSPCPVAWPFWQHTKRCRNAPSFRTQKEICSASNFFSLFFLIKKKNNNRNELSGWEGAVASLPAISGGWSLLSSILQGDCILQETLVGWAGSLAASFFF